ncbi:(Fe-S)-binding protein [Ramlibacter alkalitolerans]|uniref:(Fe-S)-binding protein n=1 Tax=Ramlibacter alkalitolerans TaxID=2039631 RepID=A0ABS1JPT4_9BURK|nr:(Fe-S)-binding protein [Ramlibacter alkalitolerans]MBL0426257.1 (Fe-S)-binding protein [Ramlibacter alkalitolerans]
MSTRPATVYFFSTCVVDLMAPQAGVDAIRLLQEAGIEVVFPQAQSCCGQPAYSSGFFAEARGVAQSQLAIFPERWPIVVPSGSCAGMIKHHWPKLFADDPALQARAQDIADRVVEWSAFAQEVLGLALPTPAVPAARPLRVALHTSCSARREMGTHVPSEALLRTLPDVEVVQPVRVTECCGFGGTFSARHPDISGAMVSDKLDALRDTGADVVVSADCGCLLNLHHAAEKRRAAGEALPRMVHLASFLREQGGAEDAAQRVTD